MKNVLPVRETLKTRHVWAGGGCPFCTFDMETMDHLFCSCPAVAQIWHEVTISHHDTLVMLVTGVLNSPNVKETIQVVATLWLLWNARNDVVWKGKHLCITDLLNQAVRLRDSWFSMYVRGDAAAVVASSVGSWTPPPSNRLKCNVDAALFADGAGFGLVLRDHAGAFVSAFCGRLPVDSGCGCRGPTPTGCRHRRNFIGRRENAFAVVGGGAGVSVSEQREQRAAGREPVDAGRLAPLLGGFLELQREFKAPNHIAHGGAVYPLFLQAIAGDLGPLDRDGDSAVVYEASVDLSEPAFAHHELLVEVARRSFQILQRKAAAEIGRRVCHSPPPLPENQESQDRDHQNPTTHAANDGADRSAAFFLLPRRRLDRLRYKEVRISRGQAPLSIIQLENL
nr:uncharacterized protein LOC109154171 [Ipomoea batatas]